MSGHPNMDDFKHITAGLYAFAATVTIVRLVIRLRNKKWWWDDTFACISMIVMPVFVAGAFIVVGADKSGSVAGYYMSGTGYYCTVWSARMSILFTIVRIAPGSQQRKVLLGFAGIFALQWLILLIQIFWVCEISRTQWKNTKGSLCILGTEVAITQVITSVVSDLALIVSPLWIIRKVQLDPILRFRLLSAFFISIATTISALIHAILVIRNPGPWEAIFGAVEAAVSLTVCNASVIIPLVARMFSASDVYREGDRSTVTIGSSGPKQYGDSTRLNNLHELERTGGPTVIHVDVAVDRDGHSQAGWDQKELASVDRESFDITPTKDVSVFGSPT